MDFLDNKEVGHGSTEFIVLSGIAGITDDIFVYYLSRLPQFRSFAITRMEGSSGRQRVPASTLKKYSFECPPYDEQKAIAHILGSLDDKIEINRRMNETLESMAQAIFKSWFVDFDPVRAKAAGRDTGLSEEIAALFPDSFEVSDIKQIPKGWRIDSLEKIAELKNQAIQPNKHPDKIWDHYSIPAFDEGQSPVKDIGSNIKSGKYIVPNNSVLASKLNPQFPRVWFPDVQDSNLSICSTEFLPFVPIYYNWRSFLYELLQSLEIQNMILNYVTGSTGSRQRIKPKDMSTLPCIIPPKKVIDAYCQLTSPLHEKQLLNLRQSEVIASFRDTLLPKLISGELRVPDVEKFIEETGL